MIQRISNVEIISNIFFFLIIFILLFFLIFYIIFVYCISYIKYDIIKETKNENLSYFLRNFYK